MKKLIKMIFILVPLLLILILSIFAWYINNNTTNASNLNVTTNTDNISIYDYINIKRYLSANLVSDEVYKKNNGYYYLYDEENDIFISDSNNNLIGMNIDSILPGEYITVNIKYSITEKLINSDFKIGLGSFDDTNGIFSIENDNEIYNHSTLGVFKVNEINSNNEYYLATYNGNYLEDSKNEFVYFYHSNFSNEEYEVINDIKYYSTTFKISLDLTQYYTLNVSTNALSEKEISIGEIRIIS